MAQLQEEEKKLFNGQVLYREWGRRFTILNQYLKGIHYYEKSTEHGDENFLWTLLGLSEALKKSGQFKKAAEVAEKCMSIDPKHLGAYYTRMEALFDVAEFCQSLVYAQRGLRRRRHFEQAVLLASGTVDDCVGANVPADVLRQLQPWIGSLGEHRRQLRKKMSEEEDEFEGIDEEESKLRVDDPGARLRLRLQRLDQRMAALYLGESGRDKAFLRSLARHRALRSANKAGSGQLVAEARACLARLQSQQDALRTRRPLYASGPGRRELEPLGRCLAGRRAGFVLRRLHEARLARDYRLFFQLAEQIREGFEALGPRLLPARARLLDVLHRVVARAYIDPRNLLRLREEGAREAHLRRALGLRVPGGLPRSTQLAWPLCLDVRAALDSCRRRLALASRPLEILCIFHELSKHFLQIGRYDLARFYSKKTRDLGLESGYEEWALNASHVLLRIELAQHNRLEAKEAAATALESAHKLKLDFLVDFYERALEYVDKLDWGRGAEDDGVASRANLMLALAPEDLRPRLGLLLRSMDVVPPRRRLSVMPGCKPRERKTGLSGKKHSVVPRPPENIQRDERLRLLKKYAPNKRILGLVDFEEYD